MLTLSGQDLEIEFRQLQATLLLISKDPGVSTVYAGGIIMMLGLAICLFFSHRRIWVKLTLHSKEQTLIQVGGFSNKNKYSFEQIFSKLVEEIDQQTSS